MMIRYLLIFNKIPQIFIGIVLIFLLAIQTTIYYQFIDSMGLPGSSHLSVARLPGRKSNVGHFDGIRLDLALAGKSGALSEFLEKHPPNLVYLLGADNVIREIFLHLVTGSFGMCLVQSCFSGIHRIPGVRIINEGVP